MYTAHSFDVLHHVYSNYSSNGITVAAGHVCCGCRSSLGKHLYLEDLYDSDVSSVHIATHKTNQEKAVIKLFKRDKLLNRVDLQNKVCMSERLGASAANCPIG